MKILVKDIILLPENHDIVATGCDCPQCKEERVFFRGSNARREEIANTPLEINVFKIAHILSGQEGVGAYTPEQLEKAHVIADNIKEIIK